MIKDNKCCKANDGVVNNSIKKAETFYIEQQAFNEKQDALG